MSDQATHDAFIEIVSLPESAREAALAALETRSPQVAAEVRRMLPFYVDEPAHDPDDDLEHSVTADDDSASSDAGDGVIHTFPSEHLLDRRSGAPRIPGHRIIEPLEYGGQSTVYLAEQSNPRRLVAIKVLRLAIMDPRARERFIAEAELQGTIRHPAIVGIHACDVVDADGRPLPWIAMELVPGARSIRQAAEDDGWDQRRRIEALATVAEAIHAAHLRGVVHRDLKPGNILVDRDGRVRIIDFGIARMVDAADGESLTREGELVGTIRYLAPEQLRGGAIDARADIHALGVLAFELLHDRSPWGQATSTSAILAAIERHEITHPKARSRADRDLNAVLARALAEDPAGRYESMAAFARDLRSLAVGNRVDARAATSLDEVRRFAARHPLPMGLSVMLVVAIAAGLVATRRIASLAELNLARGRIVQANAAIERGDYQMARRLLSLVPSHHRNFEHHLLEIEAAPTALGTRDEWRSIRNHYEIASIQGGDWPIAVTAGGGRLAVLALGPGVLLGDLRIVPRDGDEPIGEIVRITLDPTSNDREVRLVAMTSNGVIAGLQFDPTRLDGTLSPTVVLPPNTDAGEPLERGFALIDGRIAVGSTDGRIDLHQTHRTDTGAWTCTESPGASIATALPGTITSITPLQDDRVIVGTSLGTVAIVDRTGTVLQELGSVSRSIRRIRVSPDERFFAACAGRTLLYGPLEGGPARTLEGTGLIWNATFSPRSTHLAVTGRDGLIQFVETRTWETVAVNRDSNSITWSSHWEPGRLMVTTERNGVMVISTVGIDVPGPERRILAMSPSTRFTLRSDGVRWIIRDDDAQVIASGSDDRLCAESLDSVQSASIRDFDPRDESMGLVAVVAIDGQRLAGIDRDGVVHDLHETVTSPVREILLASDGRRVLWRTEAPVTRLTRFDGPGRITTTDVILPQRSPNSRYARDPLGVGLFEISPGDLRVGVEDSRLLDPESRAAAIHFESPVPNQYGDPRTSAGWMLSVAGDPDGVMYVGNHNGEVSRWEDGRRGWWTESRRSKVVHLALHPDGTRLAALHSNGTLDILDTADGTVVCTLGPIEGEPADVAISPDGRRLIAHAIDGRHRIWSWGDDERSAVFGGDG